MAIVTHTVDHYVQAHWARMNALAWRYYDIAQSSYDQFLETRENPILFPENGDPTEHFESEKRLLHTAFQTIVFSAMACEAAIYDLAAIQLGDDYATKYLDKLDVVAKWVVVPSLVCGNALQPNGPAINSLRTLTRARNALVHHKSRPGLPVGASIQCADEQLERIVQNTDTAFQAVVLLSLELNRTLKTPAGVLPFFEAGVKSLSESQRSSRISGVIHRCREIDARNTP